MLTRAKFESIILELLNKDFSPPEHGSYGCVPCIDSFIGEINPCLKDRVNNEVYGYIAVENYLVQEKALKNEIGCVGNMRLVLNDDIPQDKIAVRYDGSKTFYSLE